MAVGLYADAHGIDENSATIRAAADPSVSTTAAPDADGVRCAPRTRARAC